MRKLIVFWIVVGWAAAAFGWELNDQTLFQWHDYIQPTEEERSWRQLPWEPYLWDAVERAQREHRPLLIWAMNGHPLACT
jgi:hypothetical protein